MKCKGKVWKFGSNIDTDAIIPGRYLNVTDPEELAQHCMENQNPRFVQEAKEGDIIVKGANALNLKRKQAAVLIGHPKAGTILVALQAVLGRRVNLIVPVGLEKRINGELQTLSEKVNRSGAAGYRLFPIPGEVFTELDAVALLTGAESELIAAGGLCGAEGSVLIAVSGTEEQEKEAEKVLSSVASEPAFTL